MNDQRTASITQLVCMSHADRMFPSIKILYVPLNLFLITRACTDKGSVVSQVNATQPRRYACTVLLSSSSSRMTNLRVPLKLSKIMTSSHALVPCHCPTSYCYPHPHQLVLAH